MTALCKQLAWVFRPRLSLDPKHCLSSDGAYKAQYILTNARCLKYFDNS